VPQFKLFSLAVTTQLNHQGNLKGRMEVVQCRKTFSSYATKHFEHELDQSDYYNVDSAPDGTLCVKRESRTHFVRYALHSMTYADPFSLPKSTCMSTAWYCSAKMPFVTT